MNRREFFALGGAAAAAAGLSLAQAMSGGRDQPNLLVIITDDQPYYTVSHTKAVASLIRTVAPPLALTLTSPPLSVAPLVPRSDWQVVTRHRTYQNCRCLPGSSRLHLRVGHHRHPS